jgi:hypothetical protein
MHNKSESTDIGVIDEIAVRVIGVFQTLIFSKFGLLLFQ